MPIVPIDGSQIADWESSHDVFDSAFGFPDFYGRNMNAWIDCMTSLDDPDDGLTSVHGTPADPVVIHMTHAKRMPDKILAGLNDCAAFVNWRRMEVGEPAIIAVSYG